MHERARDDELLAHAMAVALDQLVAPFLEIEQREQLACAMLDLRSALVIQPGDEAQKLCPGELLVDEWSIRNEAELRFRRGWIGHDVDAGDLDASSRRPKNASNHAQRRRFAGAVRSEEAEQLTARHRQIDAVDGRERAVTLAERGELDHEERLVLGVGC